MNKIFSGIYQQGNNIYTKNTTPQVRYYGEKLITKGKEEFREWNPTRSKLGAALLKNLKECPINKDSKVLYLGASTGTTVSHVSDITTSGIIYALEFSERVFRNLLQVAQKRKNVVPLFVDARKPEQYAWVETCDVLFVDIAQSDEVAITIRNAELFLKRNGTVMIAIKSQSIDVTKDPKKIYEQARKEFEKAGYSVLQTINLEPFERKHAMIVAQKN